MENQNARFLGALERARRELLDLTLRNPLLKFRISTKRGLIIIDEDADQVFEVLVTDKKPLKFHHTLEGGTPRKKRGRKPKTESLNLDLPDQVIPTVKVGLGAENSEDSLATPYSAEEMEARLLATWRDAELAIQERGANFLNAAIGHLEWYEADASDVIIRAPIILVPVKLERTGARSRFVLRATDEDPGLNIALAEKLKEFGIKLPTLPENVDEVGVTGYLNQVQKAIAGMPKWKVDTHSMAIGFFSFGKFLMYRDLDPENWPDWRDPMSHELLTGLLTDGLSPTSSAIGHDEDLDEKLPAGETMEVVDCDGSQAEALAEVSHGNNLIVQGPPGTGKSQTITNMIAKAVHEGKTVLFIAEKMAALDVVKRRLDSVGLGDLCLELHSDKANKKAVVEQLKAAMDSGKPVVPQSDHSIQLRTHRDALNRYSAQLHAPVGESGLTAFQAIAKVEAVQSSHSGLLTFGRTLLAGYSKIQYQALFQLCEDLAKSLGRSVGVPAQHPYAGVRLTSLLPGQENEIQLVLEKAKQARDLAEESAQSLALALEMPSPDDVGNASRMEALAEALSSSPNLEGLPRLGSHWDPSFIPDLEKLLQTGSAHREIKTRWDARVRPKSWGAELTDAREDVAIYKGKWWCILSGKYRKAAKAIKDCSRIPQPKGPDELMEFADALAEEAKLRAGLESEKDLGCKYFGSRWNSTESDWKSLQAISKWAQGFRADFLRNAWPESVASFVVRPKVSALSELKGHSNKQLDAWKAVVIHLTEAVRLAEEVVRKMDGFAQASEHLQKWSQNLDRLPDFTYCHRLLEALRALGFEGLAELVYHGKQSAESLLASLEWNFASALSVRAVGERQELREFQVDAHSATRERFRRGDQGVFATNRARLALKHWEELPKASTFGQMGYLQEEFNRKRPRPIRKLIENASEAVQAIKPVFMMSPLSIATYLPTEGPHFDLAIFDEASQVKPVDAFGAILRANQIVVVGDDKQMPPTAFFDKLADQGDSEEDSDEQSLPDVESILGLCKARGMRDKMLKWHYRSQHESLIAVSNQEFYRDLVVFPSPHTHKDGLGLKYRYFPDTIYERGTSRTNPMEAEKVAQAVLEHVRAHPMDTLGVVAFSVGQKSMIESKLDILCKENPELDEFISNSHPEERFFVKNLENVQGDERDAIFISVGYGKDAEGKPSVNFGPVNSQGGERRLNVLISRARKTCHVFANIKADDIDLSRTTSEGVRVLRSFLAYAETGRMDLKSNTGREPDSDFEIQVAKVIEGLGYRVQPQVGCGTYRVDIGVMDPKVPGRYLAGVECDGAAYHSARWARDRDRLREGWLRKQGWNIIRVWSTDWFRQRSYAVERLKTLLRQAESGSGNVSEEQASRAFVRDGNARKKEAGAFPKYTPAVLPTTRSSDFESLSSNVLTEWSRIVVEGQFPVHRDEVVRRIVDHLGQRVTESRTLKITEILTALVRRDKIVSDGEHYLMKGERVETPRDRSDFKEFRQIEYVHDAEVKAAIQWIVGSSFGCSMEDAKSQAVRLLGVIRGAEALERVDSVLRRMVEQKELADRGGLLRSIG